MKIKGVYSLDDLSRMDYITFFKVLAEAEAEAERINTQLEKQQAQSN